MILQEIVRELLYYNPDTGKLTWKKRDRKWFKSDRDYNRWNNRYAGKEAFTALNNFGYFLGAILNQKTYAHRIIWLYQTRKWPDKIDHINHDRKDNRWVNLREVSNQENDRNQSLPRNNKSGFIGVHWHKQKWNSNIKVGGKIIYLGCFDLLEEAVSVRKEAETKYGFHKNHGNRRKKL